MLQDGKTSYHFVILQMTKIKSRAFVGCFFSFHEWYHDFATNESQTHQRADNHPSLLSCTQGLPCLWTSEEITTMLACSRRLKDQWRRSFQEELSIKEEIRDEGFVKTQAGIAEFSQCVKQHKKLSVTTRSDERARQMIPTLWFPRNCKETGSTNSLIWGFWLWKMPENTFFIVWSHPDCGHVLPQSRERNIPDNKARPFLFSVLFCTCPLICRI